MAAIHDLLKQIDDQRLRERIEREWNAATKHKKFGLVFERHLPELIPMYYANPRKGDFVCRRDGPLENTWRVRRVSDGSAVCTRTKNAISNESAAESLIIPLNELLVVREFGDPIFPALIPVGEIQNGFNDAPWHTLIEADNYHALQLLEYLYEGQVDCIYIDPPFNTGARDWKYNNDYVDRNDRWRHSKWLAYMHRRLILAKRLLAADGVLITAIDDNEYAHLWMVLNDIFKDFEHFPITIQHNPGGTQGEKFSVTHEYAIVSVSKDGTIFKKSHGGGETYNLRRWGSTSGRFEAANCFYPIYLDSGKNIIGFGGVAANDFSPATQTIKREDGTFEVWPIDKNGVEKKWRYARDTVESVRHRLLTRDNGERIEVWITREDEQPKTVWVDRLYNADSYGSGLITSILGGGFSYPKSVYAVRDIVSCAVSGKKDSLILDFFAGSGTTLNAVCLLNSADGGKRRCILVTNNEVSEDDAKRLLNEGYQVGDSEWEQHGICRSITWPRSKYTILGKRDDGTVLTGDYLSGNTRERERPRKFVHIGFVAPTDLANPPRSERRKKKQLVNTIDGLPQRLVTKDCRFIISDDHDASILFDPKASEDWLKKLTGQDHITRFYIVAQENKIFESLKLKVNQLLGPIILEEVEKRPLASGFSTNLAFFKLDFLEKEQVELRQAFREILPLLWLKAGAVGSRPEMTTNTSELSYFIPHENNFAVLLDESQIRKFLNALKGRENLSHIFIVTDAEESFRSLSDQVCGALSNATLKPKIVQLYRDYLSNFIINTRFNEFNEAGEGSES